MKLTLTENNYDSVERRFRSSHFEIKTILLVWLLLTNKSFRDRLKRTILYAMRWEDEIRGDDSPDIMFFKADYAHKIFSIKRGEDD